MVQNKTVEKDNIMNNQIIRLIGFFILGFITQKMFGYENIFSYVIVGMAFIVLGVFVSKEKFDKVLDFMFGFGIMIGAAVYFQVTRGFIL